MASYQREAQAGGYEVTRAEFEAYLGHFKDPANPSTGLIYWQMNKAWPSLQWELYGYDLDQAGVFFGAKKSGEPVHVMYAYDDGSIKVVNLTNQTQHGLRARARFLDVDGTERASSSARVPNLASQDVQTVLKPKAPAGISTTYFLELTLSRGANVVSRNVYWLSTKPDQVDFSQTIDQGFGAVFQPNGYADLTGLQSLKPASLGVRARSWRDGDEEVTAVTITNTGHRGAPPAFMARADVRRGGPDGGPLAGDNQVLPIRWTDNDVTLFAGQSQTLIARYQRSDLQGASPVVTVGGWNVPLRAAGGQ
jgi:exo-1,4-beta-D-glucosaminidase